MNDTTSLRTLRAVALATALAVVTTGCADTTAPGPIPSGGAATADGTDEDAQGGGSADASSEAEPDTSSFADKHPDATLILDIEDELDLVEWIETHSPGPEVSSGGGDAEDSGSSDGAGSNDAVTQPEAVDVDPAEPEAEDAGSPEPEGADAPSGGPDTREPTPSDTTGPEPEPDTFFEECVVLGIAESWDGSFAGDIYYNIDSGGAVLIEEGLLPIGGGLSFQISCINSKLVVNGKLVGSASVEGQGEFPFDIVLSGFFDPATGKLQASLVDGKTVIYDLVEVYFIGTFNGQLQEDGTFEGAWTAEATGTNQAFINGTGEGEGLWTAAEVPGE